MSADPRIMKPEERRELIKKLVEIESKLLLNLEEEIVNPYKNTLKRLKYAGIELN